MTQATAAEQQLAAVAEQLATANPDAAEALGRELIKAAAAKKRWLGCGIVIRVNTVTDRVELIAGE